MKKIFGSKYSWLLVLVVLAVVNFLASAFKFRLDLTNEQRFSISAPTRSLLKNIDSTITIDVFLKGEFPAVFKKLQTSTGDLLKEMKSYAGNKLQINFIKPEDFINEETRNNLAAQLINGMRDAGINVDSILQARPGFMNEVAGQIVNDSIKSLGIQPYNLQVQQKENTEQIQRSVLPAALVKYGDKVIAVDLLSGKTEYSRSTLTGRLELDEAKSISNAEALLEFKFADAISKIQRKQKPVVAYSIGNGQPMGPETYDLVNTIEKDYQFTIFDINKNTVIPRQLATLLIVKPSQPFSDSAKMKIDQYIMQGGQVIWMIDMLLAEKDSLAIVAKTLAYDRGLNIDDLLFKYGVRINRDLLQDQQCDLNKLVVGNAGGQPQLADVPFNYYPLLSATSQHPVTNKLEPVLGQFVNTIDTVKADGISKQILLTSSQNAKTVSTPAIISLEELKTIENIQLYNKKNLPAAVLLEGKFTSMYANRASTEMRDYFTKQYGSFETISKEATRQIVIGDGDVILNGYTQKEPFDMGFSRVQERTFGNKAFLQNSLEYFNGNSDIVKLRNKEVTLRILNPEKLEHQRLLWQLINIVAPVILVILGGFLFTWWRKKKYAQTK
jgi:ABC-2 type transport system permease protein